MKRVESDAAKNRYSVLGCGIDQTRPNRADDARQRGALKKISALDSALIKLIGDFLS